MKILVLGSGVIGVTTAYFLHKDGHDVTVIDRQSSAGQETSFANGGQISASQAMSWASPEVPQLMLKWLGRNDAPLLYRMRLDPKLWVWSLRFLANCNPKNFTLNTAKNLRLALYSRTLLPEIRQNTGVEYDFLNKGIIQVCREEKDFQIYAKQACVLKDLGCDNKILTAKQIFEIEPAFSASPDKIIGGVYTPDDESGDAQKFTAGLAEYLSNLGVNFRYNETVEKINMKNNRVTSVQTNKELVLSDAIIVSLASYSPTLLKPLGINIPIQPAKGYSVTVPTTGYNAAPTISITDTDHKIVFSRLGKRLRIAGTVEFTGYNTDINHERARSILNIAEHIFPAAGDYSRAEFWTGLRPLTPDGVPVIGGTKYENLYLNTGHGSLGWTMCAGSGKIISDLINNRSSSINVSDIGLNRF